MPKTAGIIIVGDEILSGKVHDSNSHFLATELRALGVDVKRISVVPDEMDTVAREVSEFSEAFDYVFTSGGVGPTHDDVTIEAISRAFGLKTEPSPYLLDYLEKRCGGKLTPAAEKMAQLPVGAEMIDVGGPFPPVVVRNVYVLPGVPELMKKKFHQFKDRFRAEPYHLRRVFVNEEECFVAHHLDAVVSEFPEVSVGSYPNVVEEKYRVIVTLESRNPDVLEKAFTRLMELLPKKIVVSSE
jgi:molybdenum cofactor synthesis domain-containing protein